MDSPKEPVFVALEPACFLCFVVALNRTIIEKGSAGWVWTTAPPDYACVWCWRRSQHSAVVTTGVPPLPPTDPGISMPLCQECRETAEAERSHQEARHRVAGEDGIVMHDRLGLTLILTEAYEQRQQPRFVGKGLRAVKECDIEDLFPDGMPEEITTAIELAERLDGPATVSNLIEE